MSTRTFLTRFGHGGVQATLSLVIVALLCTCAFAQPTFGPRKRKPAQDQPQDNTPDPDKPRLPPGQQPGVTQPPKEWQDDDPERIKPVAPEAKPGEWYCWKTADGLRYAWSLPPNFQRGKSFDLIILIHPDNMDFHWGLANHPRSDKENRGFAPDCIVVSVDGLAADARRPEARTFEPTPENCVRFRDVALEFSRVLPVRGIYLYGQGGGGRFAAFFAAAFPALADGVLAHGSGIADGSASRHTVPLVFMHGAKDAINPMPASIKAVDELTEIGHKNARLRVLRGFNDYVNAACASECIDYLRAMRTEKPDELLTYVKRMLTPKGPDEYGYRPAPWFAGAVAALKRITTEGAMDKEPPTELRQQAQDLLDKIDAHAQKHVTKVRELLKTDNQTETALSLSAGSWLGYLLALRDDFRGVPSVEAFAKDIKLDDQIETHSKSAEDLVNLWSISGSDKTKFEDAVNAITGCFLYEALPADLLPRTRACLRKADELEIAKEDAARFEYITLWDQSMRSGIDAFNAENRKWKVE